MSKINTATAIMPAHVYPTQYIGSSIEIELTCACHPHIHGRGRRSGLTVVEEWPVYRVYSWAHPEINGELFALAPDGLRPR